MKLRPVLVALFLSVIGETAAAQTSPGAPQLRPDTRTLYTVNTELFAEFTPLIVGQTTRLTAHLTKVSDHFRPYGNGTVTLVLSVNGTRVDAKADGPERPGVFRLNVTPTVAGTGRITIDVAADRSEHFVIDGIAVFADASAAQANQPAAEEPGLIHYPKERSWEEDFATGPVTGMFQGAARIKTVPSAAIVRNGATAQVYVQRTPERFELREVTTRRTFGDLIEITSGLRDGERIVVRGAEKMPRK